MILTAAFFLAIYLLSTGLAALISPAGENSKKRRKEQSTGSPEKTATAGLSRPPKTLLAALCLALGLATLAVYAQTSGYGFVNFDDPDYVYNNPIVKAGLTASGITWAFTALHSSNWHPLTWISYMLDCQLFGLDAGAYHLVNVAFHVASTLLLFLALTRMTRQPWRSALVAGIFAVHPLHVESVAWISERKDVLSAFFGMLTLLLYTRYAEAPTARRYVPMAVALALGLMAKPMLVTFPLVLLLMDLWPLRRVAWSATRLPTWPDLWPLLWEKGPLLAMAAVSCLMTILAQRNSVASLASIPFLDRLANLSIACVTYLGMAFWPADLAVLYPYHPPPAVSVIAALEILAALGLLTAVTIAAVLKTRTRPYLLVGWLWYLGMLVPVSGVVQVGVQSMADRYMYLPMVGLSIAVVWGAADLVEATACHIGARRLLRCTAALLAGATLLLFAVGSYRQVGYWRDSRTLYAHALAVTTGNWLIHNNLGLVLDNEGRHKEAIEQYGEAIALRPGFADAHNNLGVALQQSGHLEEAIVQFAVAERLASGGAPDNQTNLCSAFYKLGRLDEAVHHCREDVRLEPDDAKAHDNLGIILAQSGHLEEAVAQLTEAERLTSGGDPDNQNNLCAAFYKLGRLNEAVPHCKEALRLEPDFAKAHATLGLILGQSGHLEEAIAQLTEAERLTSGGDPANQNNLCTAFYKLGRLDEAVHHCKEALHLKPDLLPARSNLGLILAAQGKKAEGAAELSRVLAADPNFPGARASLRRLQGHGDVR